MYMFYKPTKYEENRRTLLLTVPSVQPVPPVPCPIKLGTSCLAVRLALDPEGRKR